MSRIAVAEGVARRRPGHQRRFVGVRREHGKWVASITVSGVYERLGIFASAEDAARARDARALELLGPAIRLNFPTPPETPPGARAIQLTRGKWAVVDERDYESLARWKWSATKGGQGGYYARRAFYPNGSSEKVVYIRMHREIMGVTDDALEVDHADGDGLNNRRSNLRVCTHAENGKNVHGNRRNRSGRKGVYWHIQAGKWNAYITSNGKRVSLGLYDDVEAAAAAYDAAAIAQHGEFACTNAALKGSRQCRMTCRRCAATAWRWGL